VLQGVAGWCKVLQCVAVRLPLTGSVLSRLGPRPELQGVAGSCRVQGAAHTKNMHVQTMDVHVINIYIHTYI